MLAGAHRRAAGPREEALQNEPVLQTKRCPLDGGYSGVQMGEGPRGAEHDRPCTTAAATALLASRGDRVGCVLENGQQPAYFATQAFAGQARQGETCNHVRGRICGLLPVLKR